LGGSRDKKFPFCLGSLAEGEIKVFDLVSNVEKIKVRVQRFANIGITGRCGRKLLLNGDFLAEIKMLFVYADYILATESFSENSHETLRFFH
jgi:hypothetical protein